MPDYSYETKLRNYIKSNLDSGKTRDEVLEKLSEKGHSKELIQKLLDEGVKKKLSPYETSKTKNHIVMLILLNVIFISLLAYTFTSFDLGVRTFEELSEALPKDSLSEGESIEDIIVASKIGIGIISILWIIGFIFELLIAFLFIYLPMTSGKNISSSLKHELHFEFLAAFKKILLVNLAGTIISIVSLWFFNYTPSFYYLIYNIAFIGYFSKFIKIAKVEEGLSPMESFLRTVIPNIAFAAYAITGFVKAFGFLILTKFITIIVVQLMFGGGYV